MEMYFSDPTGKIRAAAFDGRNNNIE